MKKLYTCTTVAAEQFTDECTPEGVMLAPKECLDLIDDFQLPPGEEKYIFKPTSPDETYYLIRNYLNGPYPFAWIGKGDYVVTGRGGLSVVIPEKFFQRDYLHIDVLSL
jgi:hypothetical protein